MSDKRLEAAAMVLYNAADGYDWAGQEAVAAEALKAADAADDHVRVPRERLQNVLEYVAEGRWVPAEEILKEYLNGKA